jgi:hypothetical protein
MTQTLATAQTVQDRRREPREEVPGWLVWIEGKTYPVKNWSESGFLATPCAYDTAVGEVLDLTFSVPADTRFEFSCQATVVRVDPESQELAAAFSG